MLRPYEPERRDLSAESSTVSKADACSQSLMCSIAHNQGVHKFISSTNIITMKGNYTASRSVAPTKLAERGHLVSTPVRWFLLNESTSQDLMCTSVSAENASTQTVAALAFERLMSSAIPHPRPYEPNHQNEERRKQLTHSTPNTTLDPAAHICASRQVNAGGLFHALSRPVTRV